jgi:uncharacterized protein (TIGR02679 family)
MESRDPGTPAGVAAAASRLARAPLAPLVDELVVRFGDGLPAALNLRRLDDDARSAVADLLGAARVPAATARLSIRRLLSALELPDVDHLRAAVESIRGPIPDRRASRSAASAAREEFWSWFDTEVDAVRSTTPRLPDLPDLSNWGARVRAAGIRGGPDRHRRRLERAVAVLRRLPADGVTLAALAADVLGDPHGLDRGRSVAALVVDALAGEAAAGARDAEAIRGLWERFGVAPDALSSSVLVLGLRPPDRHPLAAYLRYAASASEPVVLTLAQLRRWPLPALATDRAAFVVENPSVVAEAARRGWAGGPPLLCSSGRPTVAVVTLIRQLAAGGAAVHQHADFDAAGLAITAWLADRAGTRPWQMTAADYRAAAAGAFDAVPLTGPLPSTPWDRSLPSTMAAEGAAVYEEQLRDQLLDAIGARPTWPS